jgi:hypothetical protein
MANKMNNGLLELGSANGSVVHVVPNSKQHKHLREQDSGTAWTPVQEAPAASGKYHSVGVEFKDGMIVRDEPRTTFPENFDTTRPRMEQGQKVAKGRKPKSQAATVE